jgi:hypothetical protein
VVLCNQRRIIVANRPGLATLSESYNDFLFATVCDEANGMRLSVLSALARLNVDPWEEATRLAAMPRAIAERTLVSMFDPASGRSWNAPEAEATAARLVRLLPDPSQTATQGATMAAGANGQTAAGPSTKTAAQRATYWWVWIGFALMMSFMTPHHEAATTSPGTASSETSTPAAMPTPAPAVKSNVSAHALSKSTNPVPDPVELSH